MVTRREFLRAVPAGAFAVTREGAAQQGQRRIGWISADPAAENSAFFDAFKQGLRDLGYSEGRNIVFEPRWGDGSVARGDELAADLVRSRPDVIVTQGPAAGAVRKTGAAIPVVFGFSGDPVQAGFVQSLARPGGNLTGISLMALDLVGKRLELLKDVLPHAKRIAVVANPQHPGDQAEQRTSHAAAKSLGLTTEYFEATNGMQVEAALGAIQKSRSEAMLVFPMALMMRYRTRFAAFSVQNQIPAISGWAQFAEGGNLMSYGPNLAESFRRLAYFVDKIFRGSRPADLPVELPRRIELVLNLRTAGTLGIRLPQSLLLRADRVID